MDAGLIAPEIFQRGATTLSENVWVTPAVAIKFAVWSVETAATVAAKATLKAPVGTLTVVGTVTFELLLARDTPNPPARAGTLNPTLQTAVPGAVTLAGAQKRLLRAGRMIDVIEMLPPTPDAGIELDDAPTAATAVTASGVGAATAPGAILNVAVARMPSLITLLFAPYTMHIVLPLLFAHATILPAAVALAPAVTLTLAMSEGE
jgi:hypothetical protein